MAAETNQSYRRLPGTGYRKQVPNWVIVLLFFVIGIFALLLRGRRVRLWRGTDHLLLVDWDGAREHYKRFRYVDIQAVMIRRTREGWITSLILGPCVATFTGLALLLLLSEDSGAIGFAILLMILAGAFCVALIINIALGATCQTQLRTAVQVEEIASLSRVRHAQKALDQIRPLILAAQGQMATDEIVRRLQTMEAEGSGLVEGGATRKWIIDDPNAPPRIIG